MAQKQNLKTRLLSAEKWTRIVQVILFTMLLSLAQFILGVSTLLQVILTLFSEGPNKHLQQFGNSLGKYLQQVSEFVLWHSEVKPFPFEHWPAADTTGRKKSSSSTGSKAKPKAKRTRKKSEPAAAAAQTDATAVETDTTAAQTDTTAVETDTATVQPDTTTVKTDDEADSGDNKS